MAWEVIRQKSQALLGASTLGFLSTVATTHSLCLLDSAARLQHETVNMCSSRREHTFPFVLVADDAPLDHEMYFPCKEHGLILGHFPTTDVPPEAGGTCGVTVQG